MSARKMTDAEIEAVGRETRLKRERLRAALGNKPVAPSGDAGWFFCNEAQTECLACGPTVRTRYA